MGLTATGQYVDAHDGCPSSIDIATAAGRLTRWAGAVWQPLLSHLVLVSKMCLARGSETTALWGLLHDAHEVVTGDVPRPLKCGCTRKVQDRLDHELMRVYLDDFTLVGIKLDMLYEADDVACDLEARHFGVPGYAEASARCREALGRTPHEAAPGDQELCAAVMNSRFYFRTLNLNEQGPYEYYQALEAMRRRDYKLALDFVRRWP